MGCRIRGQAQELAETSSIFQREVIKTGYEA